MEFLGIIAAILLFGVAVFQAAVALGLPHGDMVMGGRFSKVLPTKYRFISVLTALFLLVFASVFIAKSQNVELGVNENILNTVLVVITIFLGLNTLGNLASRSNKERLIMTPITFVCMVCGILLLLAA